MNTEQQDGGPAFPVPPDSDTHWAQSGMSLRDWFAGRVLEIVSFEPVSGITRSDAEIARAAYGLADAMLSERRKGRT